MSNLKISNIESNLFDIICELHNTKVYKNKEGYKLFLAAMDDQNEEYKSLTGQYYIDPVKCAEYYSNLWEF